MTIDELFRRAASCEPPYDSEQGRAVLAAILRSITIFLRQKEARAYEGYKNLPTASVVEVIRQAAVMTGSATNQVLEAIIKERAVSPNFDWVAELHRLSAFVYFQATTQRIALKACDPNPDNVDGLAQYDEIRQLNKDYIYGPDES